MTLYGVVGETLLFNASDGVSGAELWKTDGTEAGTVLVKDINPGSLESFPVALGVVGETLFFRASDGVSGAELWKTRRHRGRHRARQGHQPRKRILEPRCCWGDRGDAVLPRE